MLQPCCLFTGKVTFILYLNVVTDTTGQHGKCQWTTLWPEHSNFVMMPGNRLAGHVFNLKTTRLMYGRNKKNCMTWKIMSRQWALPSESLPGFALGHRGFRGCERRQIGQDEEARPASRVWQVRNLDCLSAG